MFGFEWLLMRTAISGAAGGLAWLFCQWKAKRR
jgi:ammonia channel protein AmtB